MIAVLGLGFVGLATALAFADKGRRVRGYDIDARRMAVLGSGQLPFHEPGLDTALTTHLGGNFILAGSIAEAVTEAETVFVCVGTPSRPDGTADLSHVLSAIESVLEAGAGDRFRVLVIKSTVPPGSTAETIAPFLAAHGRRVGADVGLANNPEFLREGKAWDDVTRPDRIVIGVEDARSRDILTRLHGDFSAPVHVVSWSTGEFIKYLSNTMLAAMISFANDASMIAEAVGGIDVRTAFQVLHQDRRWSGDPANMASYVYPGCGFGGYCLPKDTAALLTQARLKGYPSPMLEATLTVNDRIRRHVVDRVLRHIVPGKPVGILGLAFKPGSDDVRETPAKRVIEGLIESGASIMAYDPLATAAFRAHYGGSDTLRSIHYADDLEQIAAAADPLVILTAWPEFRERKALLVGRTVLDFRYMSDLP
jgi:UDPglucose 6-dehydrogenase